MSCYNYIILIHPQKAYIPFVGKLRRMYSVSQSPIYAHFDDSVVGVVSIRAYKKQELFIQKCDQLVDENQKPYFLFVMASR